jgi:chromate transporter
VGFGGPIALVGYMQRDLVERRSWVGEREFRDGLALAQLAPGPLAAQLAIYLGWLRGGLRGATLAGVAFVLPSFLMVLALSWLYVRFGGLSWMTGAFYGIGAAVIVLIVRSAFKLGRMTLAKDSLLWAVCVANALVTAATGRELLSVFLGSGLAVCMVRVAGAPRALAAAVPPWLVTGLLAPATPAVLGQVAWFFTKSGAVVFGSGLAIVPFLYGGAVEQYGWLTERQFLDAVAVSMITPGPVVITVAFIGYLVAGPLGGTVAAVAVFLPVYLVVVIAAPHFERLTRSAWVRAFVDGVTAAATGAIAGAALLLGRRAIVDLTTLGLAAAVGLVLFSRRRVSEPVLILAAGLAGILLNPS